MTAVLPTHMISQVVPPPPPIDIAPYGYATLYAPDAHTRRISIMQQEMAMSKQQQAMKEKVQVQAVRPPMAPLRGQGMPFIYGTRTIAWSSRVPVPEPNYGVVINLECPTKPEHIGHEVFPNDDGIRNPYWYHIGALNRRIEEPLDAEDMQFSQGADLLPYGSAADGRPASAKELLGDRADFSLAWDIKGMHVYEHREAPPQARRMLPDWKTMQQLRTQVVGINMKETAMNVRSRLQSEFLDEAGVRKFFSDPNAVAYQEI